MPSERRIHGRQHERQLLFERIRRARDGEFSVTLLCGEPGIGKTRLLDDASDRAAALGMSVLRGGATDAEGMPPYLPFLDALSRHVYATPDDRLREQVKSYGAALLPLLPELRSRLGEFADDVALAPEQARFRLFESVSRFLLEIANPDGLLLVLDDLHWADAASLDLLTFLARFRRDAPIAIAGAYRVTEAEARADFPRMLVELERGRLLRLVNLGPLESTEIATLSAELLGGGLSEAVLSGIETQSRGNPFFVEELIRGWGDSHVLHNTGGTWEWSGSTPPAMPAGIARAIKQRLGNLRPAEFELLQGAAVLGLEFDVRVLSRSIGIDEVSARLLLGLGSTAQFVHADAPDGDLFAFHHDLIRRLIYDEMSALTRQRLHGLIGHAIEQLVGAGERRTADLAFHFERSGDRKRGAHYAQAAAAGAMRAFAYADAIAHFSRAIELLDVEDPERGSLLLKLGVAAERHGDEAAAISAFEDARDWFRVAGDSAGAVDAGHHLGAALWRREAIERAEQVMKEALSEGSGAESAGLVALMIDYGTLLGGSLHEHRRGKTVIEEAGELAARIGDARLSAAAGRALGNLLVRTGKFDEGVAKIEAALQIAEEIDDAIETAECCACLIPAYMWQGAIGKARSMILHRLAVAERCHDSYQLRHAYTWLAVVDALQGNVPATRDSFERAMAIVDRLASPEPLAWLVFCRGMVAFFAGDLAAAQGDLERAIAMIREFGPQGLIWYLGPYAFFQAKLGDHSAARATAAELERLIEALPAGAQPSHEAYCYLASTAMELGDAERWRRVYPRLLPFSGRFGDVLVDRLLAEIEWREGDLDAAEVHLAAAMLVAERERLGWDVAWGLELRAQILSSRGAPSTIVSSTIAQAAAKFRELGNRGDEQRLAASHTRSLQPSGLSPREVEVLQLLAGGRGNREIAERLFLSEKTVERHLSNAYLKIGVNNRAAAAAFAVRELIPTD
jgi:DNA-binding CsgD family transcriptional regulator